MEYLIRQAASKDLKALVALCAKHAEYEQAQYDSVGKEVLLESAIFADNPRLHAYVIDYLGYIAGYFTFTFDFSTWEAQTFLYLDCLYLEPEYRGLRIGEKIFERLCEIAEANNCIHIQWQTPAFNERAIKFYERIGAKGMDKKRFVMDVR